jgi:hypothetical protein
MDIFPSSGEVMEAYAILSPLEDSLELQKN